MKYALAVTACLLAAMLEAFAGPPSDVPGKVDLEAATVIADLRGWPVVADGGEIGTVQSLLFDQSRRH